MLITAIARVTRSIKKNQNNEGIDANRSVLAYPKTRQPGGEVVGHATLLLLHMLFCMGTFLVYLHLEMVIERVRTFAKK